MSLEVIIQLATKRGLGDKPAKIPFCVLSHFEGERMCEFPLKFSSRGTRN